MRARTLPADAHIYSPALDPQRRTVPGRSTAFAVALAAAFLTATAPPAAAGDLNLTLVDNSEADSWLEIDRTANTNNGSGTSGSDHDGSAVDLMDTLINPDTTSDDSKDEG